MNQSPSPHSRREFLTLATTRTVAVAATVSAATLRVSAGPETPRLRAAIIGATGRGDYGHGMDAIFLGRSGVEVVAVVDADPAGRARVGAKLGINEAHRYAGVEEMLAKEKPVLVGIGMRHADQHHEIGLACLRAGAHCYFEKPFARSADECDALLAEARRQGVRVAVAHTMRMMPSVVALKRAVQAGRFGELRELRAYGKQDARAGGEDLMVLGTHLFDLMRLFGDADPESVSATVSQQGRDITTADRRQVKDNVGWVAGDQIFAQFNFPRGVRATFTSDARLRETVDHWGIELIGSRGVARVNCDMAPQVMVRPLTPWTPQGRTDQWKPLDPALVDGAPDHNLAPVGDWLLAIQGGREPECSGRNGAWAVEMVMGIYASALGKARVAFPLVDRRHPLRPAA